MAESMCFGVALDPYYFTLAMELAIVLAVPLAGGLLGLAIGWLKW